MCPNSAITAVLDRLATGMRCRNDFYFFACKDDPVPVNVGKFCLFLFWTLLFNALWATEKKNLLQNSLQGDFSYSLFRCRQEKQSFLSCIFRVHAFISSVWCQTVPRAIFFISKEFWDHPLFLLWFAMSLVLASVSVDSFLDLPNCWFCQSQYFRPFSGWCSVVVAVFASICRW